MIERPAAPYLERRARVAVQVFARMHPQRDEPTELEQVAIEKAADAAFASKTRINDLDWQAATLRRLGYEGPVL